jgi:hypothetical protein
MGCGTNTNLVWAAKVVRGPKRGGVNGVFVVQKTQYKQIINNKSPHIRLDHSAEPVVLPIDGSSLAYNLKYVYVSQRGYYPNSLTKANQDSYLICECFLGDPNTHLFGIFDGHGECGDLCSHFAADQVSTQCRLLYTFNAVVRVVSRLSRKRASGSRRHYSP